MLVLCLHVGCVCVLIVVSVFYGCIGDCVCVSYHVCFLTNKQHHHHHLDCVMDRTAYSHHGCI